MMASCRILVAEIFPPKRTVMNRIDRLFGIVTLLQSRKFVPAETLAEKFGISVRTVYRDIRALCEQGIPVSFEPYKGYFIVQGYFLPPVSFSSDEANALLLMENMVAALTDGSIRKHYSAALQKVKAVLRPTQKEKLEALARNIRMQFPARLINDSEFLSTLQHAVSSRHILEIEYRNHNGEVSKREVEPIGLIFYAFGWHLIAWCHMRGDYRDFKVVRMLRVREAGLPFRKTDHIELGAYMKQLPVNY